LWLAAFYHFAGDVFVIGNSFRLIRFGEDFAGSQDHFASPGQQRSQSPTQRRASASLRGAIAAGA
jgi:hypothetical protein